MDQTKVKNLYEFKNFDRHRKRVLKFLFVSTNVETSFLFLMDSRLG